MVGVSRLRSAYEEVYLHEYSTPREARQSLGNYIEFYNQERPHQALNYQTPATGYRRLVSQKEAISP